MTKVHLSKVQMDIYIEANKQLFKKLGREDLSFSGITSSFSHTKPPVIPKREDFTDKVDYLRAWFALFDDELIKHDYPEHYHAEWSPYTKGQLAFAFQWVFDHFLELGLGGNMAWLGAAKSILFHIRKNSRLAMSEHFERKLKIRLLVETYWFDDVCRFLEERKIE